MPIRDLNITDEGRFHMEAASPVLAKARAAVLRGIGVQVELIRAERDGRILTPTKPVKSKDGSQTTERRLRPRKWFWRNADGTYRLVILYAHRPLPLLSNPAKTTIVCADLDEVERVLTTVVLPGLISGELDDALLAAKMPKSQP